MDKLQVSIDFKNCGLDRFKDTTIISNEIAETIGKQCVFHNDLGCYLWSFDYKLPCGVWCENIRWSGDLTEVECLVCL